MKPTLWRTASRAESSAENSAKFRRSLPRSALPKKRGENCAVHVHFQDLAVALESSPRTHWLMHDRLTEAASSCSTSRAECGKHCRGALSAGARAGPRDRSLAAGCRCSFRERLDEGSLGKAGFGRYAENSSVLHAGRFGSDRSRHGSPVLAGPFGGVMITISPRNPAAPSSAPIEPRSDAGGELPLSWNLIVVVVQIGRYIPRVS